MVWQFKNVDILKKELCRLCLRFELGKQKDL